MWHSTISLSWPKWKLVGLATALGLALSMSATVTPAHSGEIYYDRYDRPHRYSDDYDRPYRYRYTNGYERPYGYRVRYDRPRLRCDECGCSWRCGTPNYRYRRVVRPAPIYRGAIIERRYRYIERDYVERRYAAPWRERYRTRAYLDDVDDAPRPPAPIPSYYDEE
jgi:hypothetical protein